MLGKFELGGIPPAPRGQPQVEVTVEIESNGVWMWGPRITITTDKGHLSENSSKKDQRGEQFADHDKKTCDGQPKTGG